MKPAALRWLSRGSAGDFGRILFIVALLASAASALSCDPGEDVTFENRTDHAVSVFRNRDLEANLAPGEKRTFSFIEYQGSETFVARDDGGNVLLQADYTWDDLRRLHWRIVVVP